MLDAEHAEKLRRLAERTHVAPGTLARALLTSAIEEADPSSRNVTALLDSIEGSFERAQQGRSDLKNGRFIRLGEF